MSICRSNLKVHICVELRQVSRIRSRIKVLTCIPRYFVPDCEFWVLDEEVAVLPHTSLCLGQSSFWHALGGAQYFAFLHFEHVRSFFSPLGTLAQSLHALSPNCCRLRLSFSTTVITDLKFVNWARFLSSTWMLPRAITPSPSLISKLPPCARNH